MPNADTKKKAKEQAQRLVRVDGKDCTLHIGSISYFRQEELEFYWRDPEPDDAEPFELEVPDDAWQHYYRPAMALADPDRMVSAGGEEGGPDITVKIHRKIHGLLEQGQWAEARSTAIQLGAELKEEGFRPDGIRIICGPSWQEAAR